MSYLLVIRYHFNTTMQGRLLIKFVKQEEEGKEFTKILHRYTAEKLSSFGELALMYVMALNYYILVISFSPAVWMIN